MEDLNKLKVDVATELHLSHLVAKPRESQICRRDVAQSFNRGGNTCNDCIYDLCLIDWLLQNHYRN